MDEIKAVIFDWGGVLIEDPAPDFIWEFSALLGVHKNDLQLLFEEYHLLFQKGRIHEEDFWREICARLNAPIPHSNSGSLWKDVVRKVFKNRAPVWNFAEKLRNAGYKIGFLSNTEIPTREHFAERGYQRYFDAMVFSCDEGRVKPDPLIYQIALNRLEILPSETAFIDDRKDFADAATAMGIHGITFENVPQMKTKLEALGVWSD